MHLHCGIGTHMDVPAHCILHGATIEAFNPEELIVPCIVIDVSIKADAFFELSVNVINLTSFQ